MDLLDRILELKDKGYFCSQIITKLVMESIGEEKPELVKLMGGLNCGVGFSQNNCGCLTAGCCVISYFTGKGSDHQSESNDNRRIMAEFIDWFKQEYGEPCGGVNCCEITDHDPSNRVRICPPLMAATYLKVMELLANYGII